ncbi:MAG: hypothetical protein NTV17_07985 [Burkholderiales bacterium]|nr:hypothetical protein [Burkholderiales bacterium]
MGDILFIVLRRLRAPLIALIVIYAVAIAGMVAIPGVDARDVCGICPSFTRCM